MNERIDRETACEAATGNKALDLQALDLRLDCRPHHMVLERHRQGAKLQGAQEGDDPFDGVARMDADAVALAQPQRLKECRGLVRAYIQLEQRCATATADQRLAIGILIDSRFE